MKQRDENFVTMCRAVIQVLTQNTTVIASVPTFVSKATAFNGLMTELEEAMTHSEIEITGATADKSDAEFAAVKLAVNLAKRASIYALDNNNMELHDQLRVSKSDLIKRPDMMVLAKLRDIHSRLTTIGAALADYGIATADLSSLNTLVDAYDALVSRPRILIVERKGYLQGSIPEILASIREVLYRMDSLINIFSDTAFYTDYKNARIIINLGNHTPEPAPEPTV